jgi:PDGLE domain
MKRFTILVLALAIGLGTAASPFASASPDGLTRVAGEHRFGDHGHLAALQDHSPVPGYAFPGVRDARLAKGLAGFAGTLFVFGLGYGIARRVRRA